MCEKVCVCVSVIESERWLCSAACCFCCCHFKSVTDYTQKNATGGGKESKEKRMKSCRESQQALRNFAVTVMDSDTSEKFLPNTVSHSLVSLGWTRRR